MMTRWPRPLSRRTLLRGAGNIALALPWLDAMWSPRHASAQVKASRRLFILFRENGVVPGNWFPRGGERDFTLGSSMASLEPHKANLLIFDGVDNLGAGGDAGGHQMGKTTALTSQPNTSGRAQGISIDQAVGNLVGMGSRFKTLEASVFVKGTNRDALFHSGPGQALIAEDNPAALFARVFSGALPSVPSTGGMAPPAQINPEMMRLLARKQSILDRTKEEYVRVAGQVGQRDRTRLDGHLEAIRSIERTLTVPTVGEVSPTMGCKKPEAPGGSDFLAHTKAQIETLTLALACDLTRVVSLYWRSSVVSFPWAGVNDQHHGLSHSAGDAGADGKLSKFDKWDLDETAGIIQRLKSFQDVGGATLFDHTLLYSANELANGRHSKVRAPYLMATGNFELPSGKKLATGRYLKYPSGTPHSGVLTVIGQAMGLPITNFGHPQWHRGPLPNVL